MPVECAKANEDGTKTTQGVALWETQTERGRGGGGEGEKKQISFNPRHPDDRTFDIGNSMQQLKLLRDLFPNTGHHYDSL